VAQLKIQADVFAVSDTVIWPMCALAILNAVLLSRTYVLSLQRTGSASSLYTLFSLLARYMLSSCVRLSQASLVSKRLDESSWFWHGDFHLSKLCYKEIFISPKLGYFSLTLCSKLRTLKISPRHVDRVVNKTRRRRRRSSLLTTPARQSYNPLTPLLRFLVYLLYNLLLQLTRF